MDRALLERMVGAVVLVLAFVVFAPALLDGTPEDIDGAGELVPATVVDSKPGRSTKVIVLNEPQRAQPANKSEPAVDPTTIKRPRVVPGPKQRRRPRQSEARGRRPGVTRSSSAVSAVLTTPRLFTEL